MHQCTKPTLQDANITKVPRYKTVWSHKMSVATKSLMLNTWDTLKIEAQPIYNQCIDCILLRRQDSAKIPSVIAGGGSLGCWDRYTSYTALCGSIALLRQNRPLGIQTNQTYLEFHHGPFPLSGATCHVSFTTFITYMSCTVHVQWLDMFRDNLFCMMLVTIDASVCNTYIGLSYVV
jgi:hypothetical protein